MEPAIPDKPGLDGLEAKWRARWEADGTYRFDRSKPRAEVFSIDTPPPTVSGALHPGHACSYTQTDIIARYRRMSGLEVFYPMGWDDNGLNVERRVQLMRGVICDPSLPYDPDFRWTRHESGQPLAEAPPETPVPISRPNFIEQCAQVTELLERSYFELWSTLGLSVDWSLTYETIGRKARRTSQHAFLDLLARGLAYRSAAPTLWDVDFKTAVAQAELVDRDVIGAYHRLRFARADGEPLWIETTRPELLAACVAVVAHPDDERYQPLFGQSVTTPVFGVPVPVVAHKLADPTKGSGIAMICTFGDNTDVVWWRELNLPVRSMVRRDGRIAAVPPDGADADAYAQLAGKTVKQARARMVELLRDAGALDGEPRPITHAVKFWENGTRPLEIVTSQQWFIRYPDKDELIERGRQVRWHPEFMRVRYENWVHGLVGDWNITRQRFFGVPFPIWYPIGDDGQIRWDEPITAPADRLPIDPTTDVPDGYPPAQRNQPNGFAADPDVMDTWATSSLSPQIIGGWLDDPDLFERVFPMDLRPQAHDIIRTWLFYTIVRSHYHLDATPWRDTAISGFVYDPDRKKLSKSASNATDDPNSLIERYGSDAVRYWAARGRLGSDLALDPNQLRVGRKLATKILNASRFVLSLAPPDLPATPAVVVAAVDRAMLATLAEVVDAATVAFEEHDYSRALEHIEAFFWHFCDDYLELVKGRAYGTLGDTGAASAVAALRQALSVLLRLLAPFLPFVTEDAWSWWQEGSVHRSAWPNTDELRRQERGQTTPPQAPASRPLSRQERGQTTPPQAPASRPLTSVEVSGGEPSGEVLVLAVAAEVLGRVRKCKSEAKTSMRTQVDRLVVVDSAERIAALAQALDDLRVAGNVTDVQLIAGGSFDVQVELAAAPA